MRRGVHSKNTVMNKLTKAQKKKLEQYYHKSNDVAFIPEELETEIADLNWYETVYQDMARYLWDYHSEQLYGGRT
jgi:hypothetical protein